MTGRNGRQRCRRRRRRLQSRGRGQRVQQHKVAATTVDAAGAAVVDEGDGDDDAGEHPVHDVRDTERVMVKQVELILVNGTRSHEDVLTEYVRYETNQNTRNPHINSHTHT